MPECGPSACAHAGTLRRRLPLLPDLLDSCEATRAARDAATAAPEIKASPRPVLGRAAAASSAMPIARTPSSIASSSLPARSGPRKASRIVSL